MLIGNVEWRIPVVSSFEVALFFDVGNVWADPADVDLGLLRLGRRASAFTTRPPWARSGIEYGLKLDRKPGEDAGAFAFSVGYPF